MIKYANYAGFPYSSFTTLTLFTPSVALLCDKAKAGNMLDHTNLTEQDIKQIKDEGRSIDEVLGLYNQLAGGRTWTRLAYPALIGGGIISPTALTANACDLVQMAQTAVRDGEVMSFIPASGAATRFASSLIKAYRNSEIDDEVQTILDNIDQLALWHDLQRLGARFGDTQSILEALVGSSGMQIGNMPKALVPFHDYTDANPEIGARTAMLEQISQTIKLTRSTEGAVRICFTTSPEHYEDFMREAEHAQKIFSDIRLEIAISCQDPRTHTPALEMNGEPARTADGKLLFRPGGHGALLQNLHSCDRRIVLVRNIDNIVSESHQLEVVYWQRLILGKLVEILRQVDTHVRGLTNGHSPGSARDFLRLTLGVDFGTKREDLLDRLNRPWRVCGMVEKGSQPGGGPVWIRDNTGRVSLQIVESAQINHNDPEQREIYRLSTHFNPVEMAVSLHNTNGEPFDLQRYVDPSAAIITTKMVDGRQVRIIERPGLWNGSMADWNTVFVGVPSSIFAPVKTLSDLLQNVHRGRIV